MTLLLLKENKATHSSKRERYPELVDVGLNTKHGAIVAN